MSKEFDQKFDLQPLPKVEAPEWVGENIRGICEDVQKHIDKAQDVRDEVEAKLAQMSNELELADFQLPNPGEKARTRAKLLQTEMRAREQAADYYSALRLEAKEVRPALQNTVEEVKRRVQEGLFALGFEDFDPTHPFIGSGRSTWIDESRAVRSAQAALRAPSAYINDVMYDHERFNLRDLNAVKSKLIEIRDSVVAELV